MGSKESEIRRMERELREKPYLLNFLREAREWSSEEISYAVKLCREKQK